ncbi:MAG: phenylalanine--tRNA ligase subunit beta, partial [Bacteroidales bacterium]|nr:phenylalanine--tRNA ligase subunit beta [Bacteroidales bacterium]
MKISYNWLKDYIDFDLTPDELSLLLTDCGLEVEDLFNWRSVEGGLEGIVIGHVLTCEKVPDSDHLSITTVDIGGDTVLPIVCGAHNVAAGQKVIVATPGTRMTFGEKEITIKKTKLRGVESYGMICAEDEVGLGDSHEGIMVLDDSAIPGTLASDYFQIENDFVFEIGLTPNRTDAMSHIGVARDVLAVMQNNKVFKSRFRNAKDIKPSIDQFEQDNGSLNIEVVVEDKNACPRYTGLTITGMNVGESPDWLKNRLESIGLKPIKTVVDATNFVLHETGPLLHAFDADKIDGNKVVVKKLKEGTIFTTLDEVERKLSSIDLMICSTTSGMCIGGVFGGISSGVTSETKNVFLESAYFDPVSIRKTSKFHDLQTDASFRFERGVDPEMTLYALKRVAILIKDLTGGKISSPVWDVDNSDFEKYRVEIQWKNIYRLTGKIIGKEMVISILKSLDFNIVDVSEDIFLAEPPLYRVDVTREADVIEEILRIYGYNNIEIPVRITTSIAEIDKPDRDKMQTIISEYLTANGFSEVMNNSLTKAEYYTKFEVYPDLSTVNMLNPLSQDLNIMRKSLIFGGLESIQHNINRKNSNLRLFEFGNIYHLLSDKKEKEIKQRFKEEKHLGIFISGNDHPETWKDQHKTMDFYSLKSYVTGILVKLGVDIEKLDINEETDGCFNFGVEYKTEDETILELGSIHSDLLDFFNIDQVVLYASLNWDDVIELTARRGGGFDELPRFPSVRRDLALLIDKEVSYNEIKSIAEQVAGKYLQDVNLFDV